MTARCLSKDLINILRLSLESKLPGSLSAYSAVRLIDGGPLDGFKVWTDNWPDYSAVIITADKSKVKNPYLQRATFTYCENEQGLQQIIQTPDAVDVNSVFLIGASRESTKVLDNAFYDVNGFWPNPSPCDMYPCIMHELPTSHVVPPRPLPVGIREATLNEESATAMNAQWKFSEPGTLEFMKSMLSSEKILSVCLYDDQNMPIAWSMEQGYGAIGMTFVLSEFRRRGFGKYVTLRLAEKLQARDGRVYACMEPNNETSNKMHEELGFIRVNHVNSEMIWKRYYQNSTKCRQKCGS